MKPTIELQDVTIKDTIASARVVIHYDNNECGLFDAVGTVTYLLTDPDYHNAPIEDIKGLLKGFVLSTLHDSIP